MKYKEIWRKIENRYFDLQDLQIKEAIAIATLWLILVTMTIIIFKQLLILK